MIQVVARTARRACRGSPGSWRARPSLVFGALTWGGDTAGVLMLALQLGVLALATGGVFAAMILGHWYLVTPKLPEGPLVHGLARAASASSRSRWPCSSPGWGWASGRGRPAGRSRRCSGRGRCSSGCGCWWGWCSRWWPPWPRVKVAQTRSMESATGLLYINVGTIAAGTILAAGLYFGAGLFV